MRSKMEALLIERERERERIFAHRYEDIISIENLLQSWQEFLRDKKKRADIAEFSTNFSDHIFKLHNDLKNKTYRHGGYQAFKISDPKQRDIHKASVRDRLVHHALYRMLYPHFDRKFIHDSYSCRNNKGTHAAMNRFRNFSRKVSKNHMKTCWILKCDIRKFFANIDHEILKNILAKNIADNDVLNLLGNIIGSFETSGKPLCGLPLGNLTSQLLVNIYMNEFDHFVKRELKEKYYIRYADDFVFLSDDKNHLENLIPKISAFLEWKLKLELHPKKLFIKTLASGIDFLGWIHFSNHRTLRSSTKRKMIRTLQGNPSDATKDSYRGMISHGNTWKLKKISGLAE